MKRELSKSTYKKWYLALKAGVALSATDLKALTSAINNKASDTQLIELLYLAENCKTPVVGQGLLVGFESKTCIVSGQRFYPKIVKLSDTV